jgi:hypothetical protein
MKGKTVAENPDEFVGIVQESNIQAADQPTSGRV